MVTVTKAWLPHESRVYAGLRAVLGWGNQRNHKKTIPIYRKKYFTHMRKKMCLARKGIIIMVTLVTVAYKALFYKGLIGNQQHKKFGYGNLKNGYCGGIA